jgi:hypothetical protein
VRVALDQVEAGEVRALNVVVASCETPPPKSTSSWPLLMMKPAAKPRASVRSPTVLFRLKTRPGSTRVWSIRSAARWMLVSRGGKSDG